MKTTSTSEQDILRLISRREPTIHILGLHHFTQGPPRYCNSLLEYDGYTETQARSLLTKSVSWSNLQKRHKTLTGSSHLLWPEHAPYRIKTNPTLGGRKNVAIFYPFAFQKQSSSTHEIAGIELVDITENIFRNLVTHSVRSTFSNDSEILDAINLNEVSILIYLYALLHEVGHLHGPFSLLSPERDRTFLTNSELFAEYYAFSMLLEVPSAPLLQILLRLFWYQNQDENYSFSDAQVSHYLASELENCEVLKKEEDLG